MPEITILNLTHKDYYIKKPRKWLDLHLWGLALPAVIGVVGLAAFGLLAYSFRELTAVEGAWRSGAVMTGAIGLAVGGEIGTLFTNVEIYRKVIKGQATKWDWAALIISLSATFFAFLLASARLLMDDIEWQTFARSWGQAILILVSALDQYAGQMELGLYIGSFDLRYKTWEDGFHEWMKDKEKRLNKPDSAAEPTQPAEDTPKKQLSKGERLQAMVDWWASDPSITAAQMAEKVGVSTITVRNDKKLLVEKGYLFTTGKGTATRTHTVRSEIGTHDGPCNFVDFQEAGLPDDITVYELMKWSGRDYETALEWLGRAQS